MEFQYLSEFSHNVQTIALVALLCAACAIIQQIKYKLQLAKLPALDTEGGGDTWRNNYLQSARKLYCDGYQKFKDRIVVMLTADGRKNVVVPGCFLSELNKLPESILSFPKAINQVLEVKYTKIVPEPLAAYCLKADLNPALSRLSPIIYQVVEDALRNEFPPCKDWTSVYMYQKLVNIVARVSGRVFVGPELCQNEDYLDTAINYTMELANATQAIKKMNPWIRPFLASSLPEVQKLYKREELAIKFFEPIVQARRDAAKDPNYQKPDDLLQWFINRSGDHKMDSTARLVKLQLLVIFAGIHNTTVTATNILYSLAASPDYIQPLREEIRTVIAENGGSLTSRELQSMEKLDSFMKETVRFYPPELTSFQRQTVQGVTLSSGQYIPPGTFIETPAHAIYHDDANFADSNTFDGFRFYKLRQGGGAAQHARNMFVITNEQNLVFGYGKHACPGRFLAASEIKMILAKILLDYDFKNALDATGRYANHEIGRVNVPDATKPLLFKRVET